VSDEPQPGLLDRLVDALGAAMNAIGLNGDRLRWRWQLRKRNLAEQRAQADNVMRGTQGTHKMCPECRELVPKSATRCPDCGASLAGVRGPGVGRLLGNLLPGAGDTASLLTLVNGLLFLLVLMYGVKSGSGGGFLGGDYRSLIRFGMSFHIELWWRLPTAVFLHAGLIHFAFNTLALIRLGPIVEHELGGARMWVLYILCGIGGNVTHAVLSQSPVVGASGAIFGLLGAILGFGMRLGRAGAFYRQLIVANALPLIVINFLPFVSWQAHLGGFAVGYGLAWLLPLRRVRESPLDALWSPLATALVLFVLYCFFRTANDGLWRLVGG
jgi:rhomboid protease GluP